MQKLFCTDLDNTIICNEKPNLLGICVATKNNINSSYMDNKTYDKFIKIINHIKTIFVVHSYIQSWHPHPAPTFHT